jgi:hypothetical protein
MINRRFMIVPPALLSAAAALNSLEDKQRIYVCLQLEMWIKSYGLVRRPATGSELTDRHSILWSAGTWLQSRLFSSAHCLVIFCRA